MARKQVIEEIHQGAPEYMNTYGDMMTLLLCFFVLLFSMSNIDAQKFQAIVMSFSGSLGVLDAGTTLTDGELLDEGEIDDKTSSEMLEMKNFKDMEQQVKEYIKENHMEQEVSVYNEEEGLLLRFKDSLLFDQGSATIKPKADTILKYVAGMLNEKRFENKFISVEGHTDNVPIKNAKYDSNWELSVSRASNVVRYLVEMEHMNPKRFSAAGYGEYQPISGNDSDENMAKNRRVDILIMRDKENKSLKYSK